MQKRRPAKLRDVSRLRLSRKTYSCAARRKIQFGGYNWFVLDKKDGKTLIINEKVIEKRPYHHEESEITWETCDMREYLNENVVCPYRLRSPGSNGRCVAAVMVFCGDGFDQGCISINGNCHMVDGHFQLDVDGGLTGEVETRPALWLRTEVD